MRLVWSLAAAAALVGLCGCESSQTKSARLEKQASKAAVGTKGLEVTQVAKDVTAVKTTVLQDSNGVAVAVELKSTSKDALTGIPIGVDVLGPGGASEYKNDVGGIEPSLTSMASLPAGGDAVWVNDQVTASDKVSEATVKIGAGAKPIPEGIPKVTIVDSKLDGDPTSGLAVIGHVSSPIQQNNMPLYAVARRGARIVAAGRGQVPRLAANKPTKFQIFFIGNPKGADLTVTPVPTTFK